MIVELSQDRMGGVIAEPVGAKWRDRFASHMADMGERRDSSVYFQGGTDELAGEIPHRKLLELADGWTVRVRVDPWAFGHWLGYDAHTVAE